MSSLLVISEPPTRRTSGTAVGRPQGANRGGEREYGSGEGPGDSGTQPLQTRGKGVKPSQLLMTNLMNPAVWKSEGALPGGLAAPYWPF